MIKQMKTFLRKHEACTEGYSWAVKECSSLQEVWDKAKPEWLIWAATREGVLTDRELHEFALWSANQVRHLMKDERSINALEVKRKWLDGEATDEELKAAGDAAWAAAGDAAGAAAGDAAGDAQAKWIRENTKPNFGG